jgi:hypothetical protein
MLFGDLIAGRRNNCTDDFGGHRQRYGGIQPPLPLRAAIGTAARVGGTRVDYKPVHWH